MSRVVRSNCLSPQQGWMDKYFARISSLSINKELPMRIRFMLLDVIDLRGNSVSILSVLAGKSDKHLCGMYDTEMVMLWQ